MGFAVYSGFIVRICDWSCKKQKSVTYLRLTWKFRSKVTPSFR
jgi:hypothetical protein